MPGRVLPRAVAAAAVGPPLPGDAAAAAALDRLTVAATSSSGAVLVFRGPGVSNPGSAGGRGTVALLKAALLRLRC